MGGLAFIHAGFLAAGAAVALPIVIHLLFRQKPRAVPIGSIRMLQQVIREHRRRRRVRQWLLLALRVLVVALLALLFARPYWDVSAKQSLEQEWIVLVDRSASMQAGRSADDSAFARALQVARDELTGLDENVVVHAGFWDAGGVTEVPVDRFPGDAAPGNAATDYGVALAWSRDVLASSKRSRQRVVLVTDLQRSGLPSAELERLPESVELVVRDIGQAVAPNVAVTAAVAGRTEIRPADGIAIQITVRNHGALAIRGLVVHGKLDGPSGPLDSRATVDVPAQSNVTVAVKFAVTNDGVHAGRVWFDHEDSLAIDNQRWLAFEARRPDRVLLVDGQEGRSVFANETYYLETALKLRGPSDGGGRSFEVDRIVWEAGSGFPNLSGFRCVVLANVRRVTDEDAGRLNEYLTAGGNLLIFAGSQTTSASWKPLVEASLAPGQIADLPREDRLRVTRFAENHAALAPFKDPQHGDLKRLELRRSLPLESLAEDAVPLLSSGPHILAAERPVGRGRVIYLGSSADLDWTDWPRTRLYVPLVRQWLAYLTDQLAARSPITAQLVSADAAQPGIRESDAHWFVTNLDPRESALDRVTLEQWNKSVGREDAETPETAAAGFNVPLPADAQRPEEIWTLVVLGLLVALAVETLLASRVHA